MGPLEYYMIFNFPSLYMLTNDGELFSWLMGGEMNQ